MWCSLRRIHNTSRKDFSKSLLIASLIPCFSGALFYIWLRYYNQNRPTRDSKYRDPEFSGFTLVKTPPPYFNAATDGSLPGYCILPSDIAVAAEAARQTLKDHLNAEDIIIASYPKSGTTWLSEIVYLIANRLDWAKASASNLEERVPYLEYVWPGPKAIARTPSPRVIKTHLPFYHLPLQVQMGGAARIIYIVRDPRDVVVSYYNFVKCFIPAGYKDAEGLDGFVERFANDRLPYSPWDSHVQGYVNGAAGSLREHFLLVQYEKIKSDPKYVIETIEQFIRSTWIGKTCPPKLTPEQINDLVEHCSFNVMSKNPVANFVWLKELGLWSDTSGIQFMRRGIVGDYSYWLAGEHSSKLAKKASEAGLQWTLKEPS